MKRVLSIVLLIGTLIALVGCNTSAPQENVPVQNQPPIEHSATEVQSTDEPDANTVTPLPTSQPTPTEDAPSKTKEETEVPSITEITLTDPELGEYGKHIELDGLTFVNYHVPAGTYTVKNNTSWCKVYVGKDQYTTDAEGVTDNVIVTEIELESKDQTATIILQEDEHIELTYKASVTLIPQK